TRMQVATSINKNTSKRQRRTRVPNKPDYPLNLWSIMKNCIGKELSKIPMPVNFSEPLSMLQRLAEDYEYSDILDYAATLTDTQEQLAHVAAFTISSYSTTSNRTGKPFNPLLGETFECDRRDDYGWKLISEQVSHHPPMVAQHCEGKNWTCWQEFTMSSKFRGKYLQVIPLGTAHLQFHTSGSHYTWRKVTTTVHNIIVGKLWVDQHGDMDIVNHTDGSKCRLSYIPYSYFNRDTQRKVKGCVMDKDGKVSWIVSGTWDTKIEVAPVTSIEGTHDNPIYKTGPYTVAWERQSP
uniref:Oxysterol-binding protein n=3 Tax=Rhodnius TaxID=13248 RepID=T1HCH5_RHOPR